MGSIATLAVVALMILFMVSKLVHVFRVVFWRPYSLTQRFKKQGITGPPYRLLSGSLDEMTSMKKAARDTVLDTDSNDILRRVLPHFERWSSEYGSFLSIFI